VLYPDHKSKTRGGKIEGTNTDLCPRRSELEKGYTDKVWEVGLFLGRQKLLMGAQLRGLARKQRQGGTAEKPLGGGGAVVEPS